MSFARATLACCLLLLAAVAPRLGPGPRTTSRTAAQRAAWQQAQRSSSAPSAAEAYSLPPDKLAKAIALSRIRDILDLVGALWSLAVLWLLLATRAAAALEGWAERIFRRRWLQGLLFFAAFVVVLTLASLPLDAFGHHVSLEYGISIQGWGSWLGDRGKALGLAVATAVFAARGGDGGTAGAVAGAFTDTVVVLAVAAALATLVAAAGGRSGAPDPAPSSGTGAEAGLITSAGTALLVGSEVSEHGMRDVGLL